MDAPLAVNVVEFPEQSVAPATAMVGDGATVTVTVLEAEQEFDVPLTVYTVNEEGDTEMVLVFCPVFQV